MELLSSEEEVKIAESYGFEPIEDKDRGEGWFKFKKGHIYCWQIKTSSGVKWQAAYLLDGHFVGHKSFTLLEQAFKRFK